jgi:outer membrane protein OmpA-like peptidoglycan-associated protein
MSKNNTTFCICLLACASVQGQNLVPNPGFEEYITCPKETGKRQVNIIGWTQPTSGALDYFNRCSATCGVPENAMGRQEPKNGDACIGLLLFHDKHRSYAQIELKNPLAQGNTYNVEFSVSLSEKSKFAIGNIGAYFTAARFESKTDGVLECFESFEDRGSKEIIAGLCKPQIRNPSASFISDIYDWTTISGSFKARGGEKYIIIGNFYTSDGTKALDVDGKNPNAYYYIDDVAVYQSGTKPEPFPSAGFIPIEGITRSGQVVDTRIKKESLKKENPLPAKKETAAEPLKKVDAQPVDKQEIKPPPAPTQPTEQQVAAEKKALEEKQLAAEKQQQQQAADMEAAIEKQLAEKENEETKQVEEEKIAVTATETTEEQVERMLAEKENEIKPEVKPQPQPQPPTQTKSKPTILRQLFFEKNSANILPESEDELIMLQDLMLSNPDMRIEIAGHTDESGDEDMNKTLSIARAQAVSNFMQMLEIDASRMTCKGFGSSRPLFNNDTEQGREKNRRVEFRVIQ